MVGKNHFSIKPFHPPLAIGEEVPVALVAEVRLLAALDHPNVVRPVTIGESSDGHHLVMEYVEGDSLDELRRDAWQQGAEIPLRVSIRILLDALAGLAAVHDMTDARGRPVGMVHRDMSPHSVLVGADGVARIANLGVERPMGYTEVVRSHHIERRADLFAIGVMLWEGVTNRRLFDPEADGEESLRVVQHTVPRLDEVKHGVARGIAAVCARALDPDVSWRYPSAGLLAEALEGAALDGDALGTHREVAGFLQRLASAEIDQTRQARGRGRRRPFAVGTDGAIPLPLPAPPEPARAEKAPPIARGPERFGKYEVVRHLAEGGMAEIYLARAYGIEGFEKNVVIKRLKPELAAKKWATELFLQEARIAATLEHPQIAQVHDIGQVDGSYFLAMEHVRGQDLRVLMKVARQRGWQIPLEVAIRIVSELCGALHYAHDKCDADGVPLGLVHRDVSPSNVLISYDGAVKLCDFGIAEVTSKSDPRKRTRAGKLSYMSPEQCRGDDLDRRSDIFVLAIVLFELTTLSKLFKGTSEREVMRQVVEGRIRRPSQLRPDYPPELERIVMKGLAADPAGRYASAQEMMLALEAFGRDAKLAVSSVPLAQMMEELFPPAGRDGGTSGTEIDTGSDPDSYRLVDTGPPRPWHRIWLAGLALTVAIAAAGFVLAAAHRAPADQLVTRARAGAVRIADRISSQVRGAHARAAGMAMTPMLRAAVGTDERTVQDMVTHEGLLAAQAGEVIELVQRRGERTASLLRLPPGAEPTSPVAAGSTRIDPLDDALVVTASEAVVPVYGRAEVAGALVVASRLDREVLAAELPAGLRRASLRGLEREVELVPDRAAGVGEEIALPLARDLALPALTLAIATPPSAGDWLLVARWIAAVAGLVFLALYLAGRRRYRHWQRRR